MALLDLVRRALRAPVRLYVRHSPLRLGTGRLVALVLDPLVPRTGPLTLRLPGGGTARLRYEEALGRVVGWMGSFEEAELRFASRTLQPGDAAVDVGANVGLFTLVMARAVAPDGRVTAVEPHPANLARLRAHLEENGAANVDVVAAAASDAPGSITLHGADDAAFGSTAQVLEGHAGGAAHHVRATTLDGLWEAAGCPRVRLVKVDVEGAEHRVLRGAAEMLRSCRPVLLVEVHTGEALRALRRLLRPVGYRDRRPWGFDRHNRVFEVPRG